MPRPPPIDGVSASRLQLPPGPWATVLDGLCARFPAVARQRWLERFSRGRVLDAQGKVIAADAPYLAGAGIHYYREVDDEPAIARPETVLYADPHLVVADKPHFLAVMPAGRYTTETLLARLVRRLDNPDLAPLHRIDRGTAGLVLFSANRATRARYQSLFRLRAVQKRYQALAPPLPAQDFPQVRCSRIERGEPFFRMREVAGAVNSESRIDVLERGARCWRYALEPVSGLKHQLRVHMAALGAPILGDRLYPQLQPPAPDDPAAPLQLLAHSLEFDDPLDGRRHRYESGFRLAPDAGPG